MALKVVKGANDGAQEKSGTFVIEVTNEKNQIGYLCEIDGKAVISNLLIPEVVKFSKYNEAKKAANAIKGVKVRIIGDHIIEKILEEQGVREQEIIPVGSVDKEIYHVVVLDEQTGELIGYVSQKDDQYVIINNTEGASFWDSEGNADGFIKTTIEMMPPGMKLDKRKFN